jgi:hypothetical protein
MKRQSVAEARARCSDPLGDADGGQSDVIEQRRTRRKMIDHVDPHAAEGHWTWEWDDAGLDFREQRPRK